MNNDEKDRPGDLVLEQIKQTERVLIRTFVGGFTVVALLLVLFELVI
jgi:hypothetical protein